MKRFEQGFTLVELLIVIVIIAILAGITLVAYTGIQDKAKNAAMLAAYDATEKALRIYKAEKGSYPTPTDLPSGASYACVSSNLTPNSTFPNATNNAPSCFMNGTTVVGADSPQLDTALKSIIGSIPNVSSYSVTTGSINSRGLFYLGAGSSAYLFYFAKGTQPCGRGIATPYSGGATLCQLYLD